MVYFAFLALTIFLSADVGSCFYRMSKINCNTAVISEGDLLLKKPIVELGWTGERQKREASDSFDHDLTGYHLVI